MSSSGILSLTPMEVYEFVTAALECRQVPYIAGPPGIGKSQIIAQIAQDANAKLIDLRLSQILSEDLTGLPERDEAKGKAIYLPFETFPLETDKVPDGYNGWILLLDELSSASEEVLAAAYSLILDRTVGGRKLHPRCLVVAAGNRSSDSAIARELPDTLITRMLVVEMKTNVNDWVYWASNHPNKNEYVIEFISKNPSLLYSPTKAKDRLENETYPTPRGWEKVFTHINNHEARNNQQKEEMDQAGVPTGKMVDGGKPIDDTTYYLMAAAVGTMAARSLRDEYDEQIQLPFPWEVAQSPSSTRIPATGIGKSKLTHELSKYFLESSNQTRDALLTYMNRVGGEYAELFAHNIKEGVGTSASDQRLLDQVMKRLNIDPLLGGQQKGESVESDNSFPF